MTFTRLICLLVGVAGAVPVYAAHIYVSPDATSYSRLDTFYVPIRLDAQDECVNAVRVSVAYDPSELSIIDVATGDSILTLWTQAPLIERDENGERGRVTFEGGIPGGYCGRIEGDPGRTDTLVKLVARGSPRNLQGDGVITTRIILEPETTAVYRNDGTGMTADLTLLGTDISLTQATGTVRDVWMEDKTADTVSPEYFDVRLVRGPSEGSEYHYIVFSTTDKQSGIDHYEVLETDPNQFGFLSWIEKPSYWVTAESPYILRDQHLRSKILVKAVDKKGNERIIEYTPPMSSFLSYTSVSFLLPIVLFLGLIGIAGALLFRASKSRLRRHEEEEVDHAYDTHDS